MREFRNSDAEETTRIRGKKGVLLLVRVCVPRVGMCVKGRGTWEGGFVWEISVFLKTTILIYIIS